jgi:hypothetical protein
MSERQEPQTEHSGMDVGSVDECGRCGRHRVGDGSFAKDVTVHFARAAGYWYLCEECQRELNKFLNGDAR